MSDLRIRCSSLSDFMSQNVKRDGIGETSKDVIIDYYIQKKYGYRDEIFTPEIEKGLRLEGDAISLVQERYGKEFRVKNPKNYKNKILTGTPDIILSDTIEDIKCSSNIKTFYKAGLTKKYEWQGWGYMWLLEKPIFALHYVLMPDTEDMILEHEKRLYYKFGCDEDNKDYQRMCAQIRHNNDIILTMPLEDRIKTFYVKFDESLIDKVKAQYKLGVKFYDTLR